MEFIQKYARVAGSDDHGDDDNMEDDVTTSEVGNILTKILLMIWKQRLETTMI